MVELHINSGSRTFVYEIVGLDKMTSQQVELLLDELYLVTGVAWISRGYGDRLAEVSLDRSGELQRRKTFNRIQELFLARGSRLHALDRAA